MAVFYISPYDSSESRNIGGSINHAIRQLNAKNEDWVCHVDQDAMFLLPDTKARLERILSTTEYDILGTITNRLAMPYQLVPNMFDVYDIREHIKVAKARESDEVQPYTHILAAFCLCFKVSTWRKLGGFEQNSVCFDTTFSLMAHNSGLKMGLMSGVYVYHLYRSWSDKPKIDYQHLLPDK